MRTTDDAQPLAAAGYDEHHRQPPLPSSSQMVRNEKVGHLDLGAGYVGPTQNRLLRLAREYGVKTYCTHEREDVVCRRNGVSKRYKDGIFPPTGSFLSWLDLNNMVRLLDSMCRERVWQTWSMTKCGPGACAGSVESPRAREWDTMTVQQFLDAHLWTRSALETMKAYVNVNVTSEPHEVSLLWFLWYLASAGGPLRIFATSNGGQERKFIGGSQQISEGLVQTIGKEKVLLSTQVCKIEQKGTGVSIYDMGGHEYQASHCIVALAPPLQTRITWLPSLPARRNQMLQRLPMGSVIKTFVYYKTPFWRHKGLCGSAFIYDEEELVSITLDHVQHDGSHPALMGFVLADRARACGDMRVEERKRQICELYAKVFQSEEALEPVHYEEKNWAADEWSGGCYTVMMPPGLLTIFGEEIRAPVGRVHWAGTETASQWTGYMEGAIQAGERAAREILHEKGLVAASDIWQDEQEDEDVRAQPMELSRLEKLAPSLPAFLSIVVVTSARSRVEKAAIAAAAMETMPTGGRHQCVRVCVYAGLCDRALASLSA
ncbi:hypothetical protein C0Q70_21660 [Pomacea canaliculata]|uniref:Amine oxidase n=1 Tax=Pomacea canaliculata TaxID=400727 RepID=A0A2T7ND60_POMCA|nr:hypothetical protein C0Q70_21660 [Pomacea canaliculata]